MRREAGSKRYERLRSILVWRKRAKQHDIDGTARIEERLKALEDLRRMRRCWFVPYF